MKAGGVMWSLLPLAVVLSLSYIGSTTASLVVEDTFVNIKNSPMEQMVVFYHSREPNHDDALNVVKKAAKRIRKEIPQFSFKKCDCDRQVNVDECKEASFHEGTFIFTSTPSEGIVKYSLEVNVKTLVRYVKDKYRPANPEDVADFENEDWFWEKLDSEESPRPVFVKFYEQWCTHCKALAKPFNIAATYFKDRVDFVQVECSKNDETQRFCSRHEVKSYPVLILFTGEEKFRFEEATRHVLPFERFFDRHLPKQDQHEEDEEVEEAEPLSRRRQPVPAEAEDEPVARPARKARKSRWQEEEEPARKSRKGKKAKRARREAEDDDLSDEALAKLGRFSKPKQPDSAAAAGEASSVEQRLAALEAAVDKMSKKLDRVLAKL